MKKLLLAFLLVASVGYGQKTITLENKLTPVSLEERLLAQECQKRYTRTLYDIADAINRLPWSSPLIAPLNQVHDLVSSSSDSNLCQVDDLLFLDQIQTLLHSAGLVLTPEEKAVKCRQDTIVKRIFVKQELVDALAKNATKK